MPIGVGFAPTPAPPSIGGYPIINLRIGWAAKVTDALSTIAWSDVTPYLRSGSLSFGRGRELDRMEPARASFVLNDHDNRFDAANATGPYYGQIRALARVQLVAAWNGVTYPLFTGFLRRIAHQRPNLDEETATLTCVDMSTVLNRRDTPTSPWAIEIEKDNLRHWWRFSGAREVPDSGSIPMPATSYYVGNSSDLAAGGRGTSGKFNGETSVAVVGTGGPVLVGTPWLIHVQFSIPSEALDSVVVPLISQDGGGIFIRVIGSIPGFEAFRGLIQAGITNPVTGAIAAVTAGPHILGSGTHLASISFDGSIVRVSVDGVEVGTVAGTAFSTSGPFVIGAATATTPPTYPTKGEIGDVAIFAQVLAPYRITAHWDAYKYGWEGDRPGQRINRLLDFLGIPTADRAIGDGLCRLGPAQLGDSFLTHIHDVADSDGGVFFADGAGIYTYLGREYLIAGSRSITSQGKFTDVLGTGGVAYDLPLEIPVDDLYLVNRAEVTRAGGARQVVNDDVAQERDGIRPVSRSGQIFDSDDESLSAAHRLLDAHKRNGKVNSISVTPMRAPNTLYPMVLGIRMLDRLTFGHKPGATEVNEEVLVQGYEHTFSTSEWHTRISVSPAGGAFNPFVLGTSQLGTGRLY